MNISKTLTVIFAALLTSVIINSCTNISIIEKRKYRNGYYVNSPGKVHNEPSITIIGELHKTNVKNTFNQSEISLANSEKSSLSTENSQAIYFEKSVQEKLENNQNIVDFKKLETTKNNVSKTITSHSIINSTKVTTTGETDSSGLNKRRILIITFYIIGIIGIIVIFPAVLVLVAIVLHVFYRKKALAAGKNPRLFAHPDDPFTPKNSSTKSRGPIIPKSQPRAEKGKDKITLTDGTIIIGKIIEEIPGMSVKIETETGVQQIPFPSIERIDRAPK